MNPLEKNLQSKLTRRQFLIASAVSTTTIGVQAVASRIQAVAAPIGHILSKANAQLQADPKKWFLRFADNEGRPWGDGTAMAERARQGLDPWYDGCKVTTFVGGYETMSDIREAFRQAINEANQLRHPNGNPVLIGGNRGYVFISDWRLNPLRDISVDNKPWTATTSNEDPTVLGWILKLMQAGIRVRVIMWRPVAVSRFADFAPHIEEHHWLANVIRRENDRLMNEHGLDPKTIEPLGIAAIDLRVATLGIPTAAIHQKTMVIRVNDFNVAYVGGVDLAYTRRDGPDPNSSTSIQADIFMAGDHQSGAQLAAANQTVWQTESNVNYSAVEPRSSNSPQSDLPVPIYGATNQIWHDQHLRLEGPIVEALDEQFSERWRESSRVYPFLDEFSQSQETSLYVDQVLFSNERAFEPNQLIPENRTIRPPLSNMPPTPLRAGQSLVQIWRTIPLRAKRGQPPFRNGEFTVMAGISRAVQQAKELIWIFDQYFWSRGLGRLLNRRLMEVDSSLHVIIILPPYADVLENHAHLARRLALAEMTTNLDPRVADRVGVYSLWHPARNVGIYCHAKTQTYDGNLLVCGSANLNRRSFMCDAELDCAILDSNLVKEHQRKLWALLFATTPYPDINLNDPGSGAIFFQQFQRAASQSDSGMPFLIPGPIFPNKDTIDLPTDPPIRLPFANSQGFKYLTILDPSSLVNHDLDLSLDEWVNLIESPSHKTRAAHRRRPQYYDR